MDGGSDDFEITFTSFLKHKGMLFNERSNCCSNATGKGCLRNVQDGQVWSTPILNSRVAGLWLAASIPKLTHVLVSSGSMIASNHSRAAA